MMIELIGAIGFAVATAGPGGVTAQVLPTVYEAGHFYATPETASGQRLKLLVDTGGGGAAGMYWITTTAAKRLQLRAAHCSLKGRSLPVAPLPTYAPGHGIPAPIGPCVDLMTVNDRGGMRDAEGMLGSPYLAGRTWTFDYPGRRLTLEPRDWRPAPAAHRSALGFRHDADGRAVAAFPRIVIHVDGQSLDMLLDTGATAHPSPAGAKASGTPTVNGIGVASYITTGQLERWHRAHPDWPVVDQGDDLIAAHPARLIEVPTVEIAGWSVGPVWFTERPDSNFHQYMASMMDKPPEGAVGGNVFEHFVMTLDYPASTAYFRCVRGCRAATPPPAP